ASYSESCCSLPPECWRSARRRRTKNGIIGRRVWARGCSNANPAPATMKVLRRLAVGCNFRYAMSAFVTSLPRKSHRLYPGIVRQRGRRCDGGTMSKRLLVPFLATALLCSSLPAWSQELPDGPGKEFVGANCNSCHPFYARLGAGYTAQGWRTVMRMMINHGVAIPPDQLETITAYLTKNFPEKPNPVGVVIPGPAKVSIKEWQVPTPGSRPHDPLATTDGALWYTGQMNNVLGRLDPKTGHFKEYPLK